MANKGLEPRTPIQMTHIVNSVIRVIKTGNIELLTKQAYNYLYLCSGFIAHYNWYGFKDYYSDTTLLKADLLDNYQSNQWRNFHPGDENYEYYMNKAEIYKRIINGTCQTHGRPIGECA